MSILLVVMRIRKNMYKMSFGQYLGVIVDESLMRKLTKLQYETKEKILELLENSPDSYEDYSWTITNEPKEISQTERELLYIDEDDWVSPLDKRLNNMFNIEKVKDLYKVEGKYNEASEKAKAEHTEHLKNLKGE